MLSRRAVVRFVTRYRFGSWFIVVVPRVACLVNDEFWLLAQFPSLSWFVLFILSAGRGIFVIVFVWCIPYLGGAKAKKEQVSRLADQFSLPLRSDVTRAK